MDRALRRITYIEDEPDICEVARMALEALGGYTVNVCQSGAEAIDKAALFHPDLILLDVMMPDMDGVETFHALRALPETRDTPIVFVTAKVQPEELDRYRALGALDVIPKPFDPIALPEELSQIWARAAVQ